MSGATYRAVLYGPGNIGSGQEVDLDFAADGTHQDMVVIDVVEDGETIRRTFRRGHETTEPVPYRFFEESDTGGEPNVPN